MTSGFRSSPRTTAIAALACAALLVLPLGCGGGGGGGGSSGPGSSGGAASVTFEGITFRTATGEILTTPPVEDFTAVPPTLGAPLNLTIVFNFSDVPIGPFNPTSLPVFTTTADVTPEAQAPANQPYIPAKGTYVQVGTTVEFRPFVPTSPIQVKLSSPPSAVPGLLPSSTYTAQVVNKGPSVVGNLKGPGGLVKFETTSNPAAYYPTVPGIDDPPSVTASDPADASTDFYPGVWSNESLGGGGPRFADGAAAVLLTYDRELAPTSQNLDGRDIDGDGYVDPTFFLRALGTRLVVSHTVPAGTFGAAADFAAVSGLRAGQAVDASGADVFLHDDLSGALPAPDAGLTATPSAVAFGRDPSLLFLVLPVDGGNDLLTLADHALGDPSFALLAVDGSDAPVALDTGLDDIGALVTLIDGRLVAYDRTTRRLVELMPTFVRHRPTVGDPTLGAPELLALTQGDGNTGFLSSPLSDPLGPEDPEILDLVQAPTGDLYALARLGGASETSIIALETVDLDVDGEFDGDDGTFSGDPEDVLLDGLPAGWADLAMVSERELLVLDRSDDAILGLDLETGDTTVVVSEVAGFGAAPLESPALSLDVGYLELDVETTLVANGAAGAVVRLDPYGILPFGADVGVMQRHTLTSLYGTSDVNADLAAPRPPLGAKTVLRVTTGEPVTGDDPFDDAFVEEFDDDEFEDQSFITVNPGAEWAVKQFGSTSGGLRASVGAPAVAVLGDFKPSADASFKPSTAFVRAGGDKTPEADVDYTKGNHHIVLLDTDAQNFPLADGSTPSITSPITVTGGQFVFRDFIIPEGVQVIVRGTRPLVITATRTMEIHGILDLSGVTGLSDDTFNSGFLPVPGGPGGAGAGRGGDGHPTLFDPNGPGTIDQYVTPEEAEQGLGPIVGPSGQITFGPVGGRGGLSTVGYDPSPAGYPRVEDNDGNEFHRPPGGGGGGFYFRGDTAFRGSGAYRVQSSSTWFPFSKCPLNDKIHDATYGNDENLQCGGSPITPLQCVYLEGTPENPARWQPGGAGSDGYFTDADPTNNYIGEGGEVEVLIGGQGGGGGGTRVDSMRHSIWGSGPTGLPDNPLPFGPPCYLKLFIGLYLSPTVYDAKGGGGGGGGGTVLLRSYGDIVVGKHGHVDCSGGHGGGGEVVKNSIFGAGAGGGSGGAIIMQAAGDVILEADPGHVQAGFIDPDGDEGASLDVGGGMGRDARTNALNTVDFDAFRYEQTRSDGGQGGFGLIQLQPGSDGGLPIIQPGAFAFARKRAILKLGKWNGVLETGAQSEHLAWGGTIPGNFPPNELRYIDMLHYRYFAPEGAKDRFYVVNGTYPPLTPSSTGLNGMGPVNEYPLGSGHLWFDSKAMEYPPGSGRIAVVEPEPHLVFDEYFGYTKTFDGNGNWLKSIENNQPLPYPDGLPGTTFEGQTIPLSVDLLVPDGTPPRVEIDGELVFDPDNIIDRMPLVPPGIAPPPFGFVSQGTSRWIDFNGVVTRARSGDGLLPPYFEALHGTYNAATGTIPAGKAGEVVTGSKVPTLPAHFVENTGGPAFDPGLFGGGAPPDPPYNDVKVDSPDFSVQNAITDNARVVLRFQGAYPIRPGSHVPDPDTITDWVTDLTALSGYPLVRFRVVFDLGVDLTNFPFDTDSFRPMVDQLRLRAVY